MKNAITRTLKLNIFGMYDRAKGMERVGEKISIETAIPANGSVIYVLEGSKIVTASMELNYFVEHATISDKVIKANKEG